MFCKILIDLAYTKVAEQSNNINKSMFLNQEGIY